MAWHLRTNEAGAQGRGILTKAGTPSSGDRPLQLCDPLHRHLSVPALGSRVCLCVNVLIPVLHPQRHQTAGSAERGQDPLAHMLSPGGAGPGMSAGTRQVLVE